MKNVTLKLIMGMSAVLMIGCGEKEFEGVSNVSSQNADAAGGVFPPGPNSTGNAANTPPAPGNTRAPSGGVSTGGASNPMPYTPPAPAPARQTPPPAASTDPKMDFLRVVHREIFRDTQYDHAVWDPTASLTYWRNRYNPSAGIGCRAIIEAFVLAHPTRPHAVNAYGVYASGPDAALTTYIAMEYRALLPGIDPGSFANGGAYNIYRWYVDRQINMTTLDGIFLDHPLLKNRCAAAGLSF